MPKLLVNGRRSAIEIIFEMLSVCQEGEANKTAVMYRSNLSHSQLNRYLAFLEHQQLISRGARGRYQLTDKGETTLNQISEVLEILSDLQSDKKEVG